MSFTPGPWQWWDRYGYGRGVEGELHAGVREEHDFSSEDACAVVLVAAGYEADGVVASYADAALIAAAPDMFMALDQIETWAEQIEPLTGKSIGYIGLILARCRDALAKAAPESAKQEER